jgi:hypothetical protein
MRKSVLLTKAKTSVFHCRIREELHERIQGVQRRLRERGDAVFPVDQIVEEALQRATRLAEAELGRRPTAAPAAEARSGS